MIHMGSLDDLIVEVDENQATIQSFGGISVDTQDSATFETSPLQCGNIRFIKDTFDNQGYQVIQTLLTNFRGQKYFNIALVLQDN